MQTTYTKAKLQINKLLKNRRDYPKKLEQFEKHFHKCQKKLSEKLLKIQKTCKHENGKKIRIYDLRGKYKNHFVCPDCYQGWYKVGTKFLDDMRLKYE